MKNTFSKTFLMLFAFKYIKKTGRYIKKVVDVVDINEEKAMSAVENPIDPSAQGTDNLDIVAIATALHLHFDDQHEIEQTGFWLNRPLNYQTTWTAKNNLFKKSPIRKY